VKLSALKLNPNNPRFIKDDKFEKLVASIKDFPKMMELRPIVVNKDMVILGGNMRFRALQQAGYTEIEDSWVKIADKLTPEEEKRFIVEDNVAFGEWDFEILGNNFDYKELLDWGFDEYLLKLDTKINEKEIDENLETFNKCPKCGYEW
jgi:ParB-like chromosome segregation protein Spo0J